MLHLSFFHNLRSYKTISDISSSKFCENCEVHRKILPDIICNHPLPVQEGEFLYTSFNLTKVLNSIPLMSPIYNSRTDREPKFVHSILQALVIPENPFSNFICFSIHG